MIKYFILIVLSLTSFSQRKYSNSFLSGFFSVNPQDNIEFGLIKNDSTEDTHLFKLYDGSYYTIEFRTKNKFIPLTMSYGIYTNLGASNLFSYDFKIRYHFTNQNISLSPGISVLFYRLMLNLPILRRLDEYHNYADIQFQVIVIY